MRDCRPRYNHPKICGVPISGGLAAVVNFPIAGPRVLGPSGLPAFARVTSVVYPGGGILKRRDYNIPLKAEQIRRSEA